MTDRPQESDMEQFWMVRAGRGSAYVDRFRDENRVMIRFGDLPDFELDVDKQELKRRYARVRPQASPAKVANVVGQVLRFVREIEVGDWMATYDADRREYLLGHVASEARRGDPESEFSWYREVSWTRHVSRDALTQPTRNTLGSTLTLFQVDGAAAREIDRRAVPLDVPLSDVMEKTPPGDEDEEGVAESEEDDVAARAEALIEDRLVRLAWDEIQELVGGLLRAMGYQTEIAEPGPDRGVDIFASPDGLGLEEPRSGHLWQNR
ncbi:MAG TPA: restriction endonuclease, partial [Thermoanaerobaculia bacterium]|nr:restriction endonuclease [Thermoanaerobaculia bacterium]